MNSGFQTVDIEIALNFLDILKFIIPMLLAFIIGIVIEPAVAGWLYSHKVWKKNSVTKTIDGKEASLTKKLHHDEERKVPRMGGLIIVISTLLTASILYLLAKVFGPETIFYKLNFVSRGQTWVPIFGFAFAALVGAVDDLMACGKLLYLKGARENGLSLRVRLAMVGIMAFLSGLWMVYKQDITSLHVPFVGNIHLSALLFIIVVVLVVVATYSSGIIDGVDGLAGGVFATIIMSQAFIAVLQTKYDIATLCFVVVGSIFAFLWFNIPPARFFMSEVGSMALTFLVAMVAVYTNTIFILPIIGLPLVATVGSVILQLLSKKFRGGQKIFHAAPIHNHFQILGWPDYKVTMRYWIISLICSLLGISIYMIDAYF